MKVKNHTNTAEFLDLNLTSGILPTITKPTRITHTTATLIDNIYLKTKNAYNSTSAIIISHLSDHLPCLLLIDKELPKTDKLLTINQRKFTNTAKY